MRSSKLPLMIFLAFLLGCPALAEVRQERWSGRVEIEGARKLPRGTELVVEPGTTVVFKRADTDGDGMGDASLTLEEGGLTAKGTMEAPVVFTSEGPARPGEWGEIRVDFGKIEIANAIIEGSTRGLHLHFTSGAVADSIFRQNLDGTRIGESRVAFARCLFSGNTGKAFNARASTNTVEDSWFRDNKRGIFLFEGDKGSRFAKNLFTGNEFPVKLGDFFEGAAAFDQNSTESGEAPPREGPGGYLSDPAQKAMIIWSPGKVERAGPTGWPLLAPAWEAAMRGFSDADPAGDEGGVYAADWSGKIKRIGFLKPAPLAEGSAQDTIDAGIAFARVGGKPLVAVQSWNRKIQLLDGENLKILDSFEEERSPADDHRQSTPLFLGNVLYAATWAGKVRAFDVDGGKLNGKWVYDAGSPVRAGLTVAGRRIIVAAEGGALISLDEGGKAAWRVETGEALLSPPLFAGGRLIAGTKGGKLAARDPADGKTLWTAELCGPAWHAPAAFDGQAVYQGDDAGCLTAFSPEDGKILWRRRLEGGIRARPAILDGLLAVPTLGGSLYLVEAKGGLVRDVLSFGEAVHSSPLAIGQRLFFGARDGKFRAVDVRR